MQTAVVGVVGVAMWLIRLPDIGNQTVRSKPGIGVASMSTSEMIVQQVDPPLYASTCIFHLPMFVYREDKQNSEWALLGPRSRAATVVPAAHTSEALKALCARCRPVRRL